MWKYIYLLLLLAIASIWLAIYSYPSTSYIKIVACDVGQGDAFLIQERNTQILIDGGPGNRVVNCLSKHIPFWDRKIEVVVLTHPQEDHYEGLIEVFDRYVVSHFIASELKNSSQGYQVLKSKVGVRGTTIINPIPQKDIRSGLIYLDIVFPEANVLGSNTTTEDPNNYSVVLELRYKNFEMLFTGDIGPEVMDRVVNAGVDDVDVLKVPHHGSKNGLTADLLTRVEPEVAIISAGKKNRYGHPHKEVIDLLSSKGVKILRTDEMGEVVIKTDGEDIWY